MTINEYLSRDVVLYMHNTIGEDENQIENVFNMVRNHISIDEFETVLKSWNQQEDINQVALAVRYVGQMHISRFLILMDYLYVKHIMKKGKSE